MVAVSSQYNRVAIEPQIACHLLSKSGYERAMCGVMRDTLTFLINLVLSLTTIELLQKMYVS